jgi:CDP-paratose 2-epimerase
MGKQIIVTGGAGFIGCNTSARLAREGYEVTVVDNLSRKGTEQNLKWLQEQADIKFAQVDIRDFDSLQKTFAEHKDLEAVVHLAAQVAVTLSIDDPRTDFEINALGTFNVLEAVRLSGQKPLVVYASTNKVYGGMESVKVEESEKRYNYKDFPEGVPETMNLDFHSPYGCSKGAADQYVRDYSRIFDIPAVVMRQSCIYGPRQFGIEDQGWVAWFIIAAVLGKLTSIYGNGKQVRDLLYVDDLIDAYMLAIKNKASMKSKVYNLGGGTKFSLSIWEEFGPILEGLIGNEIPITKKGWRQGDQPIYISDIRLVEKELGWQPKIAPEQGIKQLYDWVVTNQDIIQASLEK